MDFQTALIGGSTIASGLISYLLNRMILQRDKDIDSLSNRIDEIEEDAEAEIERLQRRIDSTQDELRIYKITVSEHYARRDDVTAIFTKLDGMQSDFNKRLDRIHDKLDGKADKT